MALQIEPRNDWWVRALREHASGAAEDVTRDACQAALDYLEEEGQDCDDCINGWLDEAYEPPDPGLTLMAAEAILAAGDDAAIVYALRSWVVDYKMGAA